MRKKRERSSSWPLKMMLAAACLGLFLQACTNPASTRPGSEDRPGTKAASLAAKSDAERRSKEHAIRKAAETAVVAMYFTGSARVFKLDDGPTVNEYQVDVGESIFRGMCTTYNCPVSLADAARQRATMVLAGTNAGFRDEAARKEMAAQETCVALSWDEQATTGSDPVPYHECRRGLADGEDPILTQRIERELTGQRGCIDDILRVNRAAVDLFAQKIAASKDAKDDFIASEGGIRDIYDSAPTTGYHCTRHIPAGPTAETRNDLAWRTVLLRTIDGEQAPSIEWRDEKVRDLVGTRIYAVIAKGMAGRGSNLVRIALDIATYEVQSPSGGLYDRATRQAIPGPEWNVSDVCHHIANGGVAPTFGTWQHYCYVHYDDWSEAALRRAIPGDVLREVDKTVELARRCARESIKMNKGTATALMKHLSSLAQRTPDRAMGTTSEQRGTLATTEEIAEFFRTHQTKSSRSCAALTRR